MKFRSFLRYLDVRWFRGMQVRPTRPLRHQVPLQLELLERRDVFSATRPTILAVTPTLTTVETSADPVLQITYSQAMSGSATVASNYLLYDNSGTAFTVDSVTLTAPDSSGHETATVSYNEGNPLQAGTYTLLVRADLISDTMGLTISLPGQLAVLNPGRDSVAIVNVPEDGTLGTLSQYAVPSVFGFPPDGVAVAMGNLTGTPGENDLVIVDASNNQIDIYQGQTGGGYATTFSNEPLQISLPFSDSGASAILLGNYTNGVGPDIIVANEFSGTVSAFQNLSTTGTTAGTGVLNFAAPTDFNTGIEPTSLAAGDFNNDGKLDLAVADPGSNSIILLPGTGDSSFFGSSTTIPTSGFFEPDTIAAGNFDNDNKPDLVLGGPEGVQVWLNNQTGTFFSFKSTTPTVLTATPVTNVAAGVLRNTTTTPTLDDVAAVTGTGKLLVFQNLTLGSATPGTVNFSSASITTIGASPLAGLAIAPLGPNGTGANDILITQDIPDNASGGSGLLTVLVNNSPANGNITFAAPVSYAVDGDPLSLAVGDTNGDGIPDVVAVNESTNDFSLLEGTGTGTFLNAVNTTVPATPVVMASADLNGDGIPDLIIAANAPHGSPTVTVILGQLSGAGVTYGSDSFTYTLSNFSSVISVAAGDLNGDRLPDIAALSESGSTVDILVNNLATKPLGAAGFTLNTLTNLSGFGTTVANPVQVILAPFTTSSAANGVDDLLVAFEGNTGGGHGHGGGSNAGVALYANTTAPLGNNPPTFSPPSVVVSHTANGSGTAIAAIAAGNFNNATYPSGSPIEDFVVTYTPTNGTWDAAVYDNDGTGNFSNVTGPLTLTGVTNPRSLAVADLNGDGYQSIAIASQSTGTVAVLFNDGGTFAAPTYVSVPSGTGLQSISADFMNVNSPFPNLIVTTQSANASTMIDNVYTLAYDPATGSYDDVLQYLAGGSSSPVLTPSSGLILDDPLLPVTSFMPKSNIVTVNLVDNGNFSATGLASNNGGTDTVGTLLGWQTYDLPGSPNGSNGSWNIQTGATSPLSTTAVNPPSGNSLYQAMLDESNAVSYQSGNINPNAASTYQGSHALYQNITIPSGTESVSLSLTLSLYNFSDDTSTSNPQGWSDNTTTGPQTLNFISATSTPDQQVRVDIMDPNAPGFNILGTTGATGLLGNIFLTTSGDVFTPNTPIRINVAANGTITITGLGTGTDTIGTFNLAAFSGETIMLRIAETNNQGQLLVGVANVQMLTQFNVQTPPVVSNVALRDTGYTVSSDSPLANGSLPIHTTDPTIVGQISDAGGLNSPVQKGNIAYVEFDLSNDSFSGAAGDVSATTTSWDPNGNFSYSIPTSDLLPGLNTIDVAAVDNEGQVSAIVPFTFFFQGPSLSNWQSYGPDNISVPAGSTVGDLNITYTTVSGSITAVANDWTDPSGNSYYVGSDNGGVWKTADGGNDWTPLTNDVTDAKGNPIPVPVGALAVSKTLAPATNTHVVYVGTGVAGLTGSAQTGFGVLVSTDGGTHWSVDGNSGTVLAGATITAMVVDNDSPNIVYVAVASGGQFGPGIYKTSNALGNSSLTVNTSAAIWTYMTSDSVMLTNTTGTPLPAGTLLQSVTSLVEDPSNNGRLIMGIGDIGLFPGRSDLSTGVWLSSNNGGSLWILQQGGDNGVPRSTLPSGEAGDSLGRVIVAIAGGDDSIPINVQNEPNVYVLIGNPPISNTAPNFLYGNEYSGTDGADGYTNGSGLYFSPNNMDDFTNVMLRTNLGGSDTVNPANFQSIDLFGQNAADAGALIVDPNDPNVVYVGGSLRNLNPNNGNLFNGIDEFFIRVDVGNIDGINGNPNNGTRNPAGAILNDVNTGDDSSKELQAFEQGNFYYTFDKTTGLDTNTAYKGEGVYWYNLGEDAVSQGGQIATLPPDIQTLAFDTQGRLLIGTDNGLYRGVSLGYDYDFTSGGTGVLRGGGGGFGGGGNGTPNPPGMAITSLNSNLQITDLTSVAIDPSTRGQLYTTGYNIGSVQSSSLLSWSSNGLSGPTTAANGDLGIITAGSVIASQPAAGSSAGAATTLYRVWEFANNLAVDPEQSTDSGQTWSAINTTGIPENLPPGFNPAGTFPAFVVNPIPIFNSGLEQSQLLFGTNRVFISNTSGTVFDQFSPVLSSSPNGLLTALAFAPTNTGADTDVFFAGDAIGEVFVTTNDGGTWSGALGAGVLPTTAQVNAITVDNLHSNIAYVMFGYSATTIGHIYRTNNDGSSWTNVTNNLPTSVNSANSMVIVTNPDGSETIYLATNVGVFESTNAGASWKSVGNGLPNVAVVDLQYDATFGVLAAATLGRGVFTLSTQTNGPYVTDITNGSAASDTTSLTSLEVTFNEPINRATVTNADVTITLPNGLTDDSFTISDIDSVNSEVFQLTFDTPQTTNGFYTISIGTGIQDELGNPLTQTQDGVSSSDSFSGRIFYEVGTNSAPVLHSSAIAFTPAINEDGTNVTGVTSNQGVDLATWIAAQSPTLITDADSGAVQGIAITGIDDSTGTWQYSQNSGTTWTNIPLTVADTNALLLRVTANNRLRFVPNPATYESMTPGTLGLLGSASFTFRAWDLTSGLNSPLGTDGGFADASINGGTTAFSSAEATAAVKVYFDNHAPTFTVSGTGNQIILESAAVSPPVQTVKGWATGVAASATNAPNEASQTVTFVIVSDSNPGLFTSSGQPAITLSGSSSATLTYQAGQYANGTATIVVKLMDNGGTADLGQDTSVSDTFTITVSFVNQPPSFTAGGNQTILESAAAPPPVQTVNWATNITNGPGDLPSDTVGFNVSNNNASLFAEQPTIAPNGTLTYEAAQYASGSATVSVNLQNSGGTANGGQNTSGTVSFVITVLPVNQPPTFVLSNTALVVPETTAPTPQTVPSWATNIADGPGDPASDTVTFNVSNNNPSLFAVQPALAPNGTLTYEANPLAIGSATVTVSLMDNGSTANGGQTTSAPLTFTITIQAVNQPPTFTGGGDQFVTADTGPTAVTFSVPWATNISSGPANQPAEALSFLVTNNNHGLFSVQPTISANGTLSYVLAPFADGSANVTAILQNSGGTANGGQNSSAPVTFHINVFPVNQAPTFTSAGNQATSVYEGTQTVANWASNISAGAAVESWQTLTFVVTTDNPSLFLIQPSISANGTLTYEPGATVGTAHVTVSLMDSGGTANGGQNTSTPLTFTIAVNSVVSSGTADQAWIAQVYTDLLGRQINDSPSDNEVGYWINQINSGMTRLQIAEQINSSDGYHTAYVQSLFQSYLGIPADANAINYYVNTLYDQYGYTDQQVQATILSSPAYYQKNGGTNAGFVTGLYVNVLGQSAQSVDPNGLAYWEGQLTAGLSRYQVALAFVNSPAAEAQVIEAGYELLLNRPSNATAYWQGQMQAGLSNENFLAKLAASPEFGLDATAQNYNSQPDQHWLNQVFMDALNRPIDPAGMTYFLDAIRAGTSRGTIANQILNSPEYRSDLVAATFQAILNRPADSASVAYFVNYLNEGYTIEQVKAVIYASPEYYNVEGGGTPTGYLTALYRDILNSPLDGPGQVYWGEQLSSQTVLYPNIIPDPNANAVRESVALGVLSSPAAVQNLVGAGYQQLLGRPSDSGAVYWVDLLLAQSLTDAQFYAGVFASDEFYTDASK